MRLRDWLVPTGRWLLAGGWLALLLSLASVALRAYETPDRLDGFLHADAQYLPALFEDLFVRGGHLEDWALPPSPYFFPDLAIVAALRVVSASHH